MKSSLAVILFCAGCLISTEGLKRFPICDLEPEARRTYIECIRTNVPKNIFRKIDSMRATFGCQNVDCLAEKFCQKDTDTKVHVYKRAFTNWERSSLRKAVHACPE
ncbi:uncharacterized protein LOC144173723 [Haemaphysalis longicornis]